MNGLLKRMIMAILGVAVTLAWWSIRGGDSNTETADRIPISVWGGGGGTMEIEVTTSVAAHMSVTFNENSDDGRSLDTREEIEPGTHSWTIDVPAGVGGYVELGAIDPEQGAQMSWQIRLNGQVIDEQSDLLEEPLEEGYAFFIQSYYDDYSAGELSRD
jgi:hypothetical protein